MFTGIIQEVGRVLRAEKEGLGLRLSLEAPGLSPKVEVGGSVAVNGCCLTAVEAAPPRLVFQAVPETLARTALGSLRAGDGVNLELPLTASDPLGGHFVQGHVDGLARILDLRAEGEGARLRIRLPEDLAPYLVEKGSIALDGVSLTLARVEGREAEAALIPHTLAHTNLGRRKAGEDLQVEVDLLAKYVEKLSAGWRKAAVP
jgi:riboflavin synthase